MAKLNIEPDLYAFLKSNPTVIAQAGGRVYPFGETTQNTPLPYVTYQRIDSRRWRHLGGPSGVNIPRIQIDTFALSYSQARKICAAMMDQIDGFLRGMMGTAGVQCAMTDGDEDSVEEPENADEKTVFRSRFDVVIYYEE